MNSRRTLIWCNIVVKVATTALLLIAVMFPDLPQFEGKAFGSRAIAYPAAVMLIPAAWWFRWRTRPFPALADLLWSLPFLIDTAGNALDLYDTVGWWDDANHFFNWGLLSGGFTALVKPRVDSGWLLAGLCIGFGAVSAITWEVLEYWAFIRDSPELATAYEDTLGDLSLGLLGSVVTGVAVLALVRSGPSSARDSSR